MPTLLVFLLTDQNPEFNMTMPNVPSVASLYRISHCNIYLIVISSKTSLIYDISKFANKIILNETGDSNGMQCLLLYLLMSFHFFCL